MFRIAMIAAAALVFAPAAAQADDDRSTLSVRVDLHDLDLQTDAGASEALQRLTRAARRACGVAGMPTSRELNDFHRGRVCVNQAMERAVAALETPRVRMMYAERAGGGEPTLAR